VLDYERIMAVGDRARRRKPLDRAALDFVVREEAGSLDEILGRKHIARLRHPAGFTISGAVVRTFVSASLVLAGRHALGRDFAKKSAYFEAIARDIAFGVMRSHFVHGDPKGAYCCPQCTLAVYPLYEARALPWLGGPELAEDVRTLVRERGWRFSCAPRPAMEAWSLGAAS
jgi:hypothetical protein